MEQLKIMQGAAKLGIKRGFCSWRACKATPSLRFEKQKRRAGREQVGNRKGRVGPEHHSKVSADYLTRHADRQARAEGRSKEWSST
eukprot:1156436-Pelagomonas_calceolata.AAC.5